MSLIKGLTFVHLNVRSIINKIDLIRLLLTDSNIDCLCLTETWLKEIISNDLLYIEGYNVFRYDRQGVNKGGGLCVFVRDKFEAEIIKFTDFDQKDIEILAVKISGFKKGTYLCTTVYRPPKGSVEKAVIALENLRETLQAQKLHNIIIHGDFNINYRNKKCNWAKKLKDWEASSGLQQTVKSATRISQHTSTQIDLCFTNISHIYAAGTLNINIIDHLATFIVKKKDREDKRPKQFRGRDYTRLSLEKVDDSLGVINCITADSNPNHVWSEMEDNFTTVAVALCPERDYVIKRDRPAYFTTEISNLIQSRDSLFKKARSTADPQKKRKLWQKAIKKRNEVRSRLKQTKRDHVRLCMDQNRGDPKKYWRSMNSFLNKNKVKSSIKEITLEAGRKVTGLEAAERLNHYFCNIGADLARNIVPTHMKFSTESVKCKFKWEFPITESDVLKEIKSLSNSKSSGIADLNCKLLNMCLRCSVVEFTSLLNLCKDKGVFPDRWKVGTVVPIPKGNKIPLLENIRPISLLPTPGKVFEHLIHHRMYQYLSEHNLLSTKQSGFRKHYGIHDATIDLVNFMHSRFNEKKHVLCIYIDMAKAFNSLSINILMAKLQRLGFDGKSLELLKSYSEQRKQVTNFNGDTSDVGSVEFGVAQGSVLGPLLFSVYMNDLPNIFVTLDIRMYADDTVLFCEIDPKLDLCSVVSKVNHELDLFGHWCRNNLLTVNTSKTKCMLFTAGKFVKLPALIRLFLNGSVLSFVPVYRYLGVDLDAHLTMENHVNRIIARVRTSMYSLAKLRFYVNERDSVQMFKTYILPVLEFGLYLIDKPKLIDKLQKLQNKALRICLREPNTSPSYQLHCKINLLSLDLRKRSTILNFINIKLLRGDSTFSWDNRNDNRTRASGKRLQVGFPFSERFKRSISYQGPTLWNDLPKEIRENQYPQALKNSVKSYLWDIFHARKSVKQS